ncbi:MAG: RNA polymerase factor sigma-54 [Hyphomicrobiaceae bacterium]|nr:RNA polymerase factor sigma-54 [Hyphomicrobiaceae bacterium]
MALSAKLELRQGQQLIMTPQLQQAIRLLQLSNLELSAFVDAELERNPLLERDEHATDAASTLDATEPGEPVAATQGEEGWLDLAAPIPDAPAALDTSFDNLYPDVAPSDMSPVDLAGSWSSVRQRTTAPGDGETSNLEAYLTSEPTLQDHLTQQLQLTITDPRDRIIGQHLIDLVDEAGYLATDLDALADRLGAPLSRVEGVLAVLQTFDPPGVFARSLAESLALQLKDLNRYDPQIAELLANLHLLAAHNLAALKRAIGVPTEELVEMIAEIKQLNPKPGLKYGSETVHTVVPDVIVRPSPLGGWLVELNTETLPRVLVNRSYYSTVCGSTRSETERTYLNECLQNASWLAKSLDQRARTILRVSEEIVRQQDGFFAHGVEHLRPMSLKVVAEAISMHESTVSRVTSNKYMSTPRGIVELKYFFTSAIASADEGEAYSSESVRFRIKQLIDAEPAADILSDDKIVERLKSDGIDIARRTVAKYREAMRIPSSVQRRREKRMVLTSGQRA